MTLADTLTRADEFLLDRVFQKVTDRLTDRPSGFDVGISLELGAVVLQGAADIALFAGGLLGWSEAIYDSLSCACGLWFYVFMSRQRPLVRPDRPNPMRLMYRSIRLFALALTLWSAFSAITAHGGFSQSYAMSTLSNVAFVVGMYLIACQPRPPGWQAAERDRKRMARLRGVGLAPSPG